jgi:hypothetical protein
MSFKVAVRAVGENTFCQNGCAFATYGEADNAGSELLSRWFGADEYKVVESDQPVNYRWDADKGRGVPLDK